MQSNCNPSESFHIIVTSYRYIYCTKKENLVIEIVQNISEIEMFMSIHIHIISIYLYIFVGVCFDSEPRGLCLT